MLAFRRWSADCHLVDVRDLSPTIQRCLVVLVEVDMIFDYGSGLLLLGEMYHHLLLVISVEEDRDRADLDQCRLFSLSVVLECGMTLIAYLLLHQLPLCPRWVLLRP